VRSILIAFGTVFGGLLVFVGVIKVFGLAPKEPGKTIAFVSSFVAAAVASTLATRRLAGASSKGERLTLEEMEQQGLLVHEKHEATRAFQVEEFEDEGCQYFIELKNGSVLYLCGQYLYDYEPMDGGPTGRLARKFPCTAFTLLRDKRHGWIVDVECGGTVVEPEGEAPPLTEADFDSGRAPADGDIITDRSYDQLKRKWMSRK
jgi:hypothetical protein